MKKATVIKYYGSNRKTALALDLSRQAVDAWGWIVPIRQALWLEKLTHGDLKVKKDLYPGPYD